MTDTTSASKVVCLVGHCGPDSSFLRMAVSTALPGSTVTMADTDDELRDAIQNGVDLMLFNRVLEVGFNDTDGIGMLRNVKQSNPNLAVMMVSNYADAQQKAEAAGAVPGFGKSEIGSSKVTDRIRDAVGVVPA